jgi:RNA polymerase sigma factor (sigma-70 family)
MEKDLDIKLYNEYLDGEKGAFELLYNKYKDKIQYFVYNIVKDYQKVEDITQDVFVYVMQNKIKEGYTFKYYIYLVAKSRAYNQINMEKRRTEINEEYILNGAEQVGQDVADIVTKNEKRQEIIKAIDMLDDRYKNAIYLVKIEELTYQETAQILGESIQNVKNLIHRGKKELRKILIKKGFDEMSKVSKVIIIMLCISVLLAGGVYATMKIIEGFIGKAEITPTYTSGLSTMDGNKVWCGTFNLVWNDFMNDVVKGNVEFRDGESELANELNKQSFKVDQLSENSYFKIHGQAMGEDLKNKIQNGIKQKFNEDSNLIDRIDWNDSNGYVLYAMLKKEFNFLEPFSTAMGSMTFNNSEPRIKCFGVDSSNNPIASKNVEVLFYNSEDDFAIKLKTKEGEEVILYKTTGENKSFEENYKEIKKQQINYSGKNTFEENDILRIPFIKVNDEINYDELCGREIKNSNYYIKQALQTIDFELNNVGGSVKSEAVIDATQKAWTEKSRKMIFDSDFILYLKEESKEQPYFALKVDNTDILLEEEL